MNYTQEQLDLAFNNLPEALQDFIMSDEVTEAQQLIAEEYGITGPAFEMFSHDIFAMLVGLESVEHFFNDLVAKEGVGEDMANEVLSEVHKLILDPAFFVLKKENGQIQATPAAPAKPTIPVQPVNTPKPVPAFIPSQPKPAPTPAPQFKPTPNPVPPQPAQQTPAPQPIKTVPPVLLTQATPKPVSATKPPPSILLAQVAQKQAAAPKPAPAFQQNINQKPQQASQPKAQFPAQDVLEAIKHLKPISPLNTPYSHEQAGDEHAPVQNNYDSPGVIPKKEMDTNMHMNDNHAPLQAVPEPVAPKPRPQPIQQPPQQPQQHVDHNTDQNNTHGGDPYREPIE